MVKIMGEQKSNDYGRTLAVLDIDCDYTRSDGIFMTLNKPTGGKKYVPVYKTESMDPNGGKTIWNTISIDTDTLCGSNENEDILLQIF